jgi:plasmid stabilization system protein ParE
MAKGKPARQMVWSAPVRQDLEHIYSYRRFRTQDRDSARRHVRRIVEAVAPLATMPNLGKASMVSPERSYREIVFETHRINYRVETRTIYVVCVWDSRRNPDEFFA